MLEEIKELLEAKNSCSLRTRLEILEPVDIAALMDDLPIEQILPMFRILPKIQSLLHRLLLSPF
jgi:Mg/Co/Ni transporter MgtE